MDVGVVVWYACPRKGAKSVCHATVERYVLCTGQTVPTHAAPHVAGTGRETPSGVYLGYEVCESCRFKVCELWATEGRVEIVCVRGKFKPTKPTKPKPRRE